MRRGRDGVPWYAALARLALVAALSLVLWASAVAAPFVLAHALTLHDKSSGAWTLAAVAASVLGVIAFLVYLMDCS
ncbi:MAG: hypothetical protein WCP22_12555 [Chlamydiota bacterium]